MSDMSRGRTRRRGNERGGGEGGMGGGGEVWGISMIYDPHWEIRVLVIMMEKLRAEA